MKPTVTVVMDCPRCGTDLEWVNAAVPVPTAGLAIVRCPSCCRQFDVTVHLRPTESALPHSRYVRDRRARQAVA